MFFKKKTNIPENDLIKGCINGQEKSCKILYGNYYGKMLKICLRYSRDIEEAKDMVQEGYIRIFKNLNQFDFKGSFEGWMRRVMVTTAINYYQKNNCRSVVDYIDHDKLSMYEKRYSPHDGFDEILSNIAVKDILFFIQQLPPVYRTVFNLNAIEGYSHKEISILLGITESTSRSNLAKARVKLQQMLVKPEPKNKMNYVG